MTFERLIKSTTERSWNPEHCSAPVLDIKVHEDGRFALGTMNRWNEVDFANKNVGFGTSGTQEELILGTSPKTCFIVLFNKVLETNEAVMITGAKRYGDFSGYGQHTRFIGA